MRGKLIAAAALTALLGTAAGAALAAPGTESDPLVTLRYLTDTYYAEAERAMLERAQAAAAGTEQAAFDKLDALADSYLAQAGGGERDDSFTRVTLSRGARLELTTGVSLLYEAGTCELSFAAGTLVDVTDGGTVSTGGALQAGHRYVAAEDTACSLVVLSDAACLSLRGAYELANAGESGTPFTDVTFTDWYYDDVRFAYEHKLFQGLTASTFCPGAGMNRAMLATVLCRLAGMEDAAVPAAGFTDVAADAWYAGAVDWAADAGVVNGMGDGTYAPAADVTREQMAAMLYRYARDYAGMAAPASGDLTVFSDRAQISDWAEDALSWAVGHGILTGYTDGALSPGGTATRAEVAVMLRRFSALLT